MRKALKSTQCDQQNHRRDAGRIHDGDQKIDRKLVSADQMHDVRTPLERIQCHQHTNRRETSWIQPAVAGQTASRARFAQVVGIPWASRTRAAETRAGYRLGTKTQTKS